MIFEALKILRDEFVKYVELTSNNPFLVSEIVLNNISNIEGNDDLKDKLIISLVNLEEESALKNRPAFNKIQNGVRYENPSIHLNLYILFCANFPGETVAYEKALTGISYVVRFFQGNNIFTLNNSPNTTITPDPDNPELNKLKLIMDMYTLTFEQINHLWGSLGGKQVPFVMYKARLIEIRDRRIQKGGEVIKEITSSEEIS